MRNIITQAIIAALIALMAACTGKPAPVNQADDSSGDDAIAAELSDEADSLGYFLGLSMAETIRDEWAKIPENHRQNIDPELFNNGVRSILSVTTNHTGFEYGAIHGATIQDQLSIFRECGIKLRMDMFMSGFATGMDADTTDTAPKRVLDKLMTPVNSRIIIKKRRSSPNNNFRRPDGTIININ